MVHSLPAGGQGLFRPRIRDKSTTLETIGLLLPFLGRLDLLIGADVLLMTGSESTVYNWKTK